MRVGIVTKEWPPHIYGGAGVHAFELTKALRTSITVDVHCFGEARADADAYSLPENFAEFNPALQAFATDIEIAQKLGEVDLIHSHTWYANMAGHWAALLHGKPHVITAHSLEPDRPWKSEQLGGGYRLSSWAERTAYESADAIIAVSNGMRADVLRAYPDLDPNRVHTILNGVDTEKYRPTPNPELLKRYGISGKYVLFVGRITRQKGLSHLLRAWKEIAPDISLVLAAGSPDEPAIGAEVSDLIHNLQAERGNILWFEKMLPQDEVRDLLSSASLFVCPSIYEPLGIVNLEAMACQTAVLASRVGGIPEVVQDGLTGELIDYTGNAQDFEANLAEKISELIGDDERRHRYATAGRARVIQDFSWSSIAQQTESLYQSLISSQK